MMKVVLLIKSNLSAEEAFRNLLWLSDLDAIFLEASRVYNLHLIAIFSLNSQGDPKEFLPFLQELELMSPPILLYIFCTLHMYARTLKVLLQKEMFILRSACRNS